MKRASSGKHALLAASLTVAFALWGGPVIAVEKMNPDADEILRSMSSFLAGMKTFSVSVDISNEILTQEGQKLQLNSYATVLLQRPSHLHVARQGRFANAELFYDGRKLTIYDKTLNAYFQKDLAGTTDEAYAELESGLGMDVPGADLVLSAPYPVLASGVTSSGYYGKAYVQGVECHHLAFRKDNVDWQLWVKVGDEPLPMKYLITTKWMTGAPQFSVQLSNWNTKPVVAAGQFTFAVPKGAKRLEALAVDEIGELAVKQEGK
jgi:hypothetical protein